MAWRNFLECPKCGFTAALIIEKYMPPSTPEGIDRYGRLKMRCMVCQAEALMKPNDHPDREPSADNLWRQIWSRMMGHF